MASYAQGNNKAICLHLTLALKVKATKKAILHSTVVPPVLWWCMPLKSKWKPHKWPFNDRLWFLQGQGQKRPLYDNEIWSWLPIDHDLDLKVKTNDLWYWLLTSCDLCLHLTLTFKVKTTIKSIIFSTTVPNEVWHWPTYDLDLTSLWPWRSMLQKRPFFIVQ